MANQSQRLIFLRRFKDQAILLVAFFTVVFGLLVNNANGQESVSKEEKNKKFAGQLWDYLLANNYKHWTAGPGKTINHFSNQDADLTSYNSNGNPHGTYLKSYMNRKAAGNPENLPVGSIVILENYRKDKSLESISVMYRSPGFNPSANDWYWVKYNADGSVATAPAKVAYDANGIEQTYASNIANHSGGKLMGRANSCIACHQQSGGTDLAFFNDRYNRDVQRLVVSEEIGK